MSLEARASENLSPEFRIYGTGEIGDKARQLIEKQAALKAAGFRTPVRAVLAEGFFDPFFTRFSPQVRTLSDAEDVPGIVETVTNGNVSQDKNSTLLAIRRILKETNPSAPLMVRSSAKGDARGTGIYTSVTKPGTQDGIMAGVNDVVASYFSEDATAFRRDADTGKGFGVIIEPMVGQPLEVDVYLGYHYETGSKYERRATFGPVLSGIAYTSTTRGEGYITVVPGYGGGVDRRGAERLTRAIVEHTEESPRNKIVRNRQSWSREDMTDNRRGEGLRHFVTDTDAWVPNPSRNYALMNGKLMLPDDVKQALHPDIFLQLFDNLDTLEQQVGKPQYVEWAMTLDGTTPQFWAVQVSDVDKKIDVFEASERYSKTMFTAGEVTGSGAVDAEKIVVCRRPDQIPSLEQFNEENEGYVLVYFEDLTSNNIFNTGRRLGYRHISNAKVVLELPGGMGHYDGPPISHFGGMIESTGKIFGVLAEHGEGQDWSEFAAGREHEEGLDAYHGKIKVIADERKNKLEVTVEPKLRPDVDADYDY